MNKIRLLLCVLLTCASLPALSAEEGLEMPNIGRQALDLLQQSMEAKLQLGLFHRFHVQKWRDGTEENFLTHFFTVEHFEWLNEQIQRITEHDKVREPDYQFGLPIVGAARGELHALLNLTKQRLEIANDNDDELIKVAAEFHVGLLRLKSFVKENQHMADIAMNAIMVKLSKPMLVWAKGDQIYEEMIRRDLLQADGFQNCLEFLRLTFQICQRQQ